MENCIFCKIASKIIPADIIYEDKNNLAFLDNKPHTKGHTIVIPKVHITTFLEMSDSAFTSLLLTVKKTTLKIKEKLDPDGFNIGWNHNTAAGQIVPHFHIHIMPRYNGDNGGSIHSIINNPGKKSVEEIAKLFK